MAEMIALFTDFGLQDPYVGQLHGVIGDCHDGVRVIDLHHNAPTFQPRMASLLLEALVPYLPIGVVVIGVVDPGVGTARRGIVVEASGRWFVGPDNGLFSPFFGHPSSRIHQLEKPSCAPKVLSDSFHGRDLFAPAGAAITRGEPEVFGTIVTDPVQGEDGLRESVVYVDHYGNLMSGIPCSRGLGCGGEVTIAGARVPPARTFGEVRPGVLFWYCNSLERIEVAAREDSAHRLLKVGLGEPLTLEPAG